MELEKWEERTMIWSWIEDVFAELWRGHGIDWRDVPAGWVLEAAIGLQKEVLWYCRENHTSVEEYLEYSEMMGDGHPMSVWRPVDELADRFLAEQKEARWDEFEAEVEQKLYRR